MKLSGVYRVRAVSSITSQLRLDQLSVLTIRDSRCPTDACTGRSDRFAECCEAGGRGKSVPRYTWPKSWDWTAPTCCDGVTRLGEQKENWAGAHYNLGNAYLQGEQYDNAVTAYKKAIELKEELVVNKYGEETNVLLPRVVADLCIGCGICEYQCPVEGESAIRIRTANGFAF